jgi:hypothetical protein
MAYAFQALAAGESAGALGIFAQPPVAPIAALVAALIRVTIFDVEACRAILHAALMVHYSFVVEYRLC